MKRGCVPVEPKKERLVSGEQGQATDGFSLWPKPMATWASFPKAHYSDTWRNRWTVMLLSGWLSEAQGYEHSLLNLDQGTTEPQFSCPEDPNPLRNKGRDERRWLPPRWRLCMYHGEEPERPRCFFQSTYLPLYLKFRDFDPTWEECPPDPAHSL